MIAAACATAVPFLAVPARAQLIASVSIESDYRLRAYSVTEGQPAANLDLGYDDASGLYADVNATARLGHGPDIAAVQGMLGYARGLSPTLSLDLGVTRMQFMPQSDGQPATGYTEAYAGLVSRQLSTRAYYSPDYLGRGISTLYAEVEGGVEPAQTWRLGAHFGRLTYLSGASARRNQHDWRLSAAHDIGRIEVHAALSGGGPSSDYYRGTSRSRTAFVVGARLSF